MKIVARLAWLLLAAALCQPLSAQRQNPLSELLTGPSEQEAAAEPLEKPLAERLREAEQDLADLRQRLRSESADPGSALALQADLLEQVVALLERQQSQQSILEDLDREFDQLQEQLETLRETGPGGEPPYSFLRLAAARGELRAHLQQESTLESAREALRRALQQARDDLEEREAERRRAKEAMDTNQDPQATARLARELRDAELEVRRAREHLALRRLELETRARADELYRLRTETLRERVAWLQRDAEFPRDLLDDELEEIANKREQAAQLVQALQQQLAGEQQRLSQLRDSPEDVPEARLGAARSRVETLHTRIKLEIEYQASLAKQEVIWNQRYKVFHGEAEGRQLAEWSAEAVDERERLATNRELHRLQSDEMRQQIVNLQERIAAEGRDPQLAAWLQEQVVEARKQAEAYEAAILRIDDSLRLVAGLIEEIGLETGGATFTERLWQAWVRVQSIWNTELTHFEDTSITVGKLVVVLILVVGGVWASRRISISLGRRVLPRVGLDEGVAAAVQALFYYTLVLFFTLIALYLVNVPLTAFTVLGGAVAIGVGFGSQNVMRNFISGIILLTERPIRVGDLVQLDEIYGTIERIGLRSTQVLSSDNVDIIVPNSTFLEQNVINWTLSDDRYRAKITVGVAYGSPTREVVRLIERAAEEHGKVLKTPAPIVLFSDFGDNALVFEAHFWLRMRRLMDARTVQSDLRHRIDALFREAGITIAFPQRDVHLDSLSPLKVRLLPEAEAEESPEAADTARKLREAETR